jgi:hypothetical protein
MAHRHIRRGANEEQDAAQLKLGEGKNEVLIVNDYKTTTDQSKSPITNASPTCLHGTLTYHCYFPTL